MATILHLLPTCPVTSNSSHFTQLPSHPICSRIIKAVSNKPFLIPKVLMDEKGSSPHSTAKGNSLASGPPCLEPPSLYSWGVQTKTHLAEDVRWALLYQLLGQLLSCINQHRSFEFHIACEFTSSWEALPWAVIHLSKKPGMEGGSRSSQQTSPPFCQENYRRALSPVTLNQLKGRENRTAERSGKEALQAPLAWRLLETPSCVSALLAGNP